MQQTAERPAKPASRPATGPAAKSCPKHGSKLTGGPVIFTCSTGLYGGHSVTAADLPHAWS